MVGIGNAMDIIGITYQSCSKFPSFILLTIQSHDMGVALKIYGVFECVELCFAVILLHKKTLDHYHKAPISSNRLPGVMA
jgi:hypothetical protein